MLKHGLYKHPLYWVWLGIRQRCLNPKNPKFIHYGARGITICEDWLKDFLPFYNWSMENGYARGLTIERKDNDCGYHPDNCIWITQEQQLKNRRSYKQRKARAARGLPVGIYPEKGRFRAQIWVDGINRSVGSFSDVSTAVSAREKFLEDLQNNK